MLKHASLLTLAACLSCPAQPQPNLHAETLSTITFGGPPGEEKLEITNVGYEVTASSIPGRPSEQRLLLRKTTRSNRFLNDIGVEATTTLDAWPFPGDPAQKPLYSLTVTGTDGRVVDNALYVVSRGLEEVDWWSVYKLGSVEHLFDTYVPLVAFSISRNELTQRYVGLEAPGDDASDARLKRGNVVAVLTYASAERVIREAIVTCDDFERAQLLRSYSDTSRTVALVETPDPARPSAEQRRTVRISFTPVYPSAPNTVTLSVPIARDDLDLAHSQVPPGMHVAAWKR